MKTSFAVVIIIIAAAFIGVSLSMYTVDQTEQAIVLQLGQPMGEVKEPGLHFKIPLVQDVVRFDKRILSVDPRPSQMVISSSISRKKPVEDIAQEEVVEDIGEVSGEPIVVDAFARYQIVDPLAFMKTLRTIPAANQRLESIMNEATRSVLGSKTLYELLSPARAEIMTEISNRVNRKTAEEQLGIQIVDIRIVRADLTPELRQSTVRRMISELKKRATETRAKGEERALEISSTAEKERTVILAEAERDAQIIRGGGDKEAIKIYADAFNRDKEFYGFIRSMEAYKNTLADPDTRLILSPDSEFFRYFGSDAVAQ